MTLAPATLTPLQRQILGARAAQVRARLTRDRSANNGTIAAAKLADREVDVLLDRLSAALRNR